MFPFYEKSEKEIRVFRAVNMQFPPHLHSALELVYQEEGELTAVVDGQRIQVPQGGLLVVFPNLIHEYLIQPTSNSSSLLILSELKLLPMLAPILQRKLPEELMLTEAQLHGDVSYALHGLDAEANGAEETHIMLAFLQLLLARILPDLSLKEANAGADSDFTYRLIRYISGHFQEALSLELLAKELGTSKYYISRVFSKKLRINFRTYLNQLRLDYAVKLLRTTDLLVSEISQEAGFENERTFHRVFLKMYGIPPMACRR